MRPEIKPTPGEIERAKVALCHHDHPMVERVAQALADTRERERKRCLRKLRTLRLPGAVGDIEDAIQKGEP